jgi:hypothetical protein
MQKVIQHRLSKLALITVLSLSMVLASAGAVFASEGGPAGPSANTVSVTSGEELNAALGSLTDNGSLVINLANDIDAITSATYTGYKTGASITINGNGFTINGGGVNDTALRFGARGQTLDLTVTNTTFLNLKNDDRQGGGAIGLWTGSLVVSGSTFSNNAATGGVGGAIRHQGGTSTSISDSTFTGNSASGAGGALNIGAPGAITNVTVSGNTGTAPGGGIAVPNGRNGAAPAAVKLIGSTVIGNAPNNVLNILDGGGNIFGDANVLGIVRADESTAQTAVFHLIADLAISDVNLIEATVNYDPAKYDLTAVSPVTGAAVQIVKNDEAAGQVKVVIGVQGQAAIGHSSALVLAALSLTPKDGVQPATAYVEISSAFAYAAGEKIDLTIAPRDAASAFTYRDRLDVNNDGAVDAADLSLVLYYFGAQSTELPADIKADVNRDGLVDALDITELVNVLYA